MSFRRVVRLPQAADVADLVAERLLELILDLQTKKDSVHVCLTGGQTANLVYERFAELAATSELDARKLHLWWTDECFVAATDPARYSLQAIERLARTIPINSSHIHMMAAKDGRKDSHESAEVYENELGDVAFDVTLLGIGKDGHCASLFPDVPAFANPGTRLVMGVEDSPLPPPERISLTLNALNRSRSVWFMAMGETKARAVAAALNGEDVPAARVQGERSTLWFLDDQAAGELPKQFRCEL